MDRRQAPKAIVATAALLLAASCSLTAAGKPEGRRLPHFELTNWDGRRISSDYLRGKTTILAFTYAKCVYSCPLITYQLKDLDNEIGSPPDLRFLHISVNPSMDTPEEILCHFEKFGIDPMVDDRWLFVGGAEKEVSSVLADFGIEVKRTPVENGHLIDHTIRVLVVDPAGVLVASFDSYHWDKERMHDALRL